MNRLTIVVVVCLAALAQGRVLRTKDENTRELVELLEKFLDKISLRTNPTNETEESESGSNEDPFEALESYLKENERDILIRPVFKVPARRIQSLLRNVSNLLDDFIDEDMETTVGVRFVTAFFEHVIYEGMEKIWEIADTIASKVEGLSEMSIGTREKRDLAKRSLDERKKKLAFGELSSQKTKLSKKFFEESVPKVDMRTDQDVDDDNSTDGSGIREVENCHFSAVWEHIAGPAYEAIHNITATTNEYDYYYWGNIFYAIQWGVEDAGILHETVEEAVHMFAHQLGTVLFAPPAVLPPEDIWSRILPVMIALVVEMENFNGTLAPEVEELTEDQARIFKQIYSDVEPLIREASVPLRNIVTFLIEDNEAELEDAILNYLGTIIGRQLYIISNLAQILRENILQKNDSLAVIDQAWRNGKSDDILVAMFSKFGEAGLAQGERIENLIWFFGHVLEHLAHIFDGDFTPKESSRTGNRRGRGKSRPSRMILG